MSRLTFLLTVTLLLFLCASTAASAAATKTHTISFGKWVAVPWSPDAGTTENKLLTIKVRSLLVDARPREFTLGPPHDVTDRLFVIRRAFRVNDSLPEESAATPHWQWQPGGWLLVDRNTGHISTVNLPEFDAFYSVVSWYRDYAAYCGISDVVQKSESQKFYAVVAQLSRRKPVLKKLLDKPASDADAACSAPTWQRTPARVTFDSGVAKETFAIRGHAVEVITQEEDEEEASK